MKPTNISPKAFGIILVMLLAVAVIADVNQKERYNFDFLAVKKMVELPLAASCTANAVGSNVGWYTVSSHNRSQIQLTNADTDGCSVTVLETGAYDGEVMTIINVGAQSVAIAEESGVVEGSGTSTLGQYDAVSYRYIGDRFVQVSEEQNN